MKIYSSQGMNDAWRHSGHELHICRYPWVLTTEVTIECADCNEVLVEILATEEAPA